MEKLFQAMDSDNDREITWEEFLLFYNGVQKNKEENIIDFSAMSTRFSSFLMRCSLDFLSKSFFSPSF